MNLIEWLEAKVKTSRRLESSVRKHGANAMSSYGGALAASIAAVIGTPAAGFAAIPFVVGTVILVNKLEHDYKEKELLDFYRDQIAAVKSGVVENEVKPEQVTVSDLRHFAAGTGEFAKFGPNPLMQRELDNYNQDLKLAIGTHLVTAAIFAAMAITFLPAVTSTIGALGIGAGALLVFDQIDGVIGSVGRMLFASPGKTVQKDIESLQNTLHAGTPVTPLQVYSVLAKAMPDVRDRLKEKYNTHFDNMYLSQKQEAMLQDGERMQLGNITKALNSGRMEAEDLALLLGNPLTLQDGAVVRRLQQLHTQDAIEQASVMADKPAPAEAPVMVAPPEAQETPPPPPAPAAPAVSDNDNRETVRFAVREQARRAVASVAEVSLVG